MRTNIYAKLLSFSLAIALFATGCGSGGSAEVRAIQASPDAGLVDIQIDGNNVSTDVSYTGGTAYQTVHSGTRKVSLVSASTGATISSTSVNTPSSGQSTVVFTNVVANIDPVILTDQTTAPASGTVQIRVMQAAPDLPAVDVYAVPLGGTLTSGVTPLVTGLQFQSATSYQSLNAGTYTIYLTQAGTVNAYASSGQIAITTGQVRTFVALDQTGGGFTMLTLNDLN